MKERLESLTPLPAGAVRPETRRGADVALSETWRDALLRLSIELPIDLGLDEVVRIFLDRLVQVLPTLAVGVCVVSSSGAAPIVSVRLPPEVPPERERDPTRLFPLLAEERTYPLADGATGSTFHVACPTSVGYLTPFHREVGERGAWILGAGLARARAYHGARRFESRVDELKAQIIQAEKLASLGQIVAGVVHELNNPLTSILAYAEHLARRFERPESAVDAGDVERIRRIIESADRILKFTRDLVAYARPTPETPRLVHLEHVVGQALGFCEHEFAVRSVRVDRAGFGELPPLSAVAGQLTQVFVNLFTNAVHSMSNGGGVLRIEANFDAATRTLIAQVSDTGSGIFPEHLPQIFEPFFTTKPDGHGTGLGLSIVHDIIDAHGGTVAVRSHPALGTTFTVVLPVADIQTTRITSTKMPF